MTTVTPDPSKENHKRSFRELLVWLFLIPVVAGTLLCCGQLALISQTSSKLISSLSQLKVDYKEWADSFTVPSVNAAALIEDANKEAAQQGTPLVALPGIGEVVPTGEIWVEPKVTGTPGVVANIPTFTPTVQRTYTPTATKLPTKEPSKTSTPRPTISVTPSPTSTRTVIWFPITNTPTNEPPPKDPTHTFTPSITYTVTNTPTATFTPTNTHTVTNTPTITSTPTDTPTFTETPTPTMTFTVTSTPTPTATLAPLRAIVENGGKSDAYDATSCVAYFGYKNDNPVSVTIPVDNLHENHVEGTGITSIVNQTIVFEPGRQYGTFSVIWNTSGSIIWWLQGKPVTASWCH